MVVYGLQHVMSMYAGVVAVPLIVGTAMGLPFGELAYLLTAALLVSGLATLLQTLGIWRIGARQPLVQGTSFAAVASMLAIGKGAGGGAAGLTAIYGAVIVAGVVGFLLAPVFNRLLHLFPPVVTGVVITVIGISLLPVSFGWAGGGTGTPNFGDPANIALAAVTLLIILAIYRFLPGFLSRVAILAGLVLGTLVAWPFGKVDFSRIGQAQWFAVSTPFHFGAAAVRDRRDRLDGHRDAGDHDRDHGRHPRDRRGDRPARGRPHGGRRAARGHPGHHDLRRPAQRLPGERVRAERGPGRDHGHQEPLRGGGERHHPGGARARAQAGRDHRVDPAAGAGWGRARAVRHGRGERHPSARPGWTTTARPTSSSWRVAIAMGVLPIASPTFYEHFPAWFQTIFDSGISAAAITAVLLNLLFNGMRRDAEAPIAAEGPTPGVIPDQDVPADASGQRSNGQPRMRLGRGGA